MTAVGDDDPILGQQLGDAQGGGARIEATVGGDLVARVLRSGGVQVDGVAPSARLRLSCRQLGEEPFGHDGGGLMALADLETAVRVAGGRGLAVVWNDAAYSAEVMLYGAKGLADAPMRIPEVDFAALARAVGAEGVVVWTVADLDALQAWTARDADERPFLLLDLRISGDVIAPYFAEVVANSH